MSYPRVGSANPLHPDQHGWPRARVLSMHRDDADILPCQTDAELEAAWVQEREVRALVARVHVHAVCGHRCESGGCVVMAGLNDPLCIACQLKPERINYRTRGNRRSA